MIDEQRVEDRRTMTPSVSFVVPCYNYGRFVGQALDSLLGQTCDQLEIIVIDDASTDGSAEVIRRYEYDPRVRVVVHEKNQGHIQTYNEGLSKASGIYVGLLSADDYCLRPDAVERQVDMFERHPHIGMVYSAHSIVENDANPKPSIPWEHDDVRRGAEEFSRLMWGNYIHASGTLLRRDVQDDLGYYDARLGHAGDWDMWLRAAARYDVGYIAEPLYAYRMHHSNMSHSQVSPFQATDEVLMTLDRAFAALGDEAPLEIAEQRDAVLRHALLQSVWIDLFHGRYARVWRGFAYALRRQPSLLASRSFWSVIPHALLMAAGPESHQRVVGLLDGVRRRR
jgi:glycosyltransferase involved in cell wall biosynthesis